jgi:hypothetical protein
VNTTQSKTHCKAKTKEGKPCRAAATEGGLCFFHANPNKAAELGRVGGKRSRHPFTDTVDPRRGLKSMKDVRDAVDQLIENLYAGKISPRIAGCVAPLLNLQMRAIQATDLEMRIRKLELSQTESRDPAHDSPEIHPDSEGKGSGPAEFGSD